MAGGPAVKPVTPAAAGAKAGPQPIAPPKIAAPKPAVPKTAAVAAGGGKRTAHHDNFVSFLAEHLSHDIGHMLVPAATAAVAGPTGLVAVAAGARLAAAAHPGGGPGKLAQTAVHAGPAAGGAAAGKPGAPGAPHDAAGAHHGPAQGLGHGLRSFGAGVASAFVDVNSGVTKVAGHVLHKDVSGALAANEALKQGIVQKTGADTRSRAFKGGNMAGHVAADTAATVALAAGGGAALGAMGVGAAATGAAAATLGLGEAGAVMAGRLAVGTVANAVGSGVVTAAQGGSAKAIAKSVAVGGLAVGVGQVVGNAVSPLARAAAGRAAEAAPKLAAASGKAVQVGAEAVSGAATGGLVSAASGDKPRDIMQNMAFGGVLSAAGASVRAPGHGHGPNLSGDRPPVRITPETSDIQLVHNPATGRHEPVLPGANPPGSAPHGDSPPGGLVRSTNTGRPGSGSGTGREAVERVPASTGGWSSLKEAQARNPAPAGGGSPGGLPGMMRGAKAALQSARDGVQAKWAGVSDMVRPNAVFGGTTFGFDFPATGGSAGSQFAVFPRAPRPGAPAPAPTAFFTSPQFKAKVPDAVPGLGGLNFTAGGTYSVNTGTHADAAGSSFTLTKPLLPAGSPVQASAGIWGSVGQAGTLTPGKVSAALRGPVAPPPPFAMTVNVGLFGSVGLPNAKFSGGTMHTLHIGADRAGKLNRLALNNTELSRGILDGADIGGMHKAITGAINDVAVIKNGQVPALEPANLADILSNDLSRPALHSEPTTDMANMTFDEFLERENGR